MKKSQGSNNLLASAPRMYVGKTDHKQLADFDLIKIHKDSWTRFLEKDLIEILKAVSYTHLDVYKRQGSFGISSHKGSGK